MRHVLEWVFEQAPPVEAPSDVLPSLPLFEVACFVPNPIRRFLEFYNQAALSVCWVESHVGIPDDAYSPKFPATTSFLCKTSLTTRLQPCIFT